MYEIKLKTLYTTSDILIDNNILESINSLISKYYKVNKIHVISDENVISLYKCKLKNLEYSVTYSILTAGEQSKTLDNVYKLYADLITYGIDKNDLIIALGGGVIGDIAGYTAATYLRGINFCQIPTSLLAQVDSSVGGKCGVDLPQGKNLVGVINQPRLVLIDPTVLTTLKTKYYNDGLGEVIKYACIKNKNIFNMLDDLNNENIIDLIYECVKIKTDFVKIDEFDKNERMMLNFGHTIGHAIEKMGNFTEFSHGEAVSVGMCEALKIAKKFDFNVNPDKLVYYLNKFNLPKTHGYSSIDLLNIIKKDKKKVNEYINFIMLKEYGESVIKKIKIDEIFT